MTGFGRGMSTDGWQVEVRTVNHRYLDLALRLPEPFRALEPGVRAAVGAVLRRGRVDVTLVSPSSAGTARVVVDTALAASYDAALKEIAGLLGRDTEAPAALFLRLPGVCRLVETDPGAAASVWPTVEPALREALEAVVAMRAREGAALKRTLAEHAERLERYHGALTARLPAAAEALRVRWLERWRQGTEDADLPEGLVQSFDRGDVAEELARIASHLEQVRDALGIQGPAGRRLDFLAQELQREWTTVSAKAADAEIARLALEARVVADQFREQVQNVE